MIERISWPEKIHRGMDPFQPKSATPLKLTLHTQSFGQLSEEEEVALNVLRELGQLDEVSFYGFEGEDILIIQVEEKGNQFHIKIKEKDGISHHRGFSTENLREGTINGTLVQRNSGYSSHNKTNFEHRRNELICIEAHSSIRNHIFVTGSLYFLQNRDAHKHENIRSPKEALEIVGLLLRARNNWIYKIIGRSTYSAHKDYFYLAGFFNRIPNYLKMVNVSWNGNIDRELLYEQFQSFQRKCKRVLETKDYLGTLFYTMQNQDIRDSQLYYFDYLILLIAGAFDSLAEISNILYGLHFNERKISFRNPGFMTALANSPGTGLVAILENDETRHLSVLLNKLRNTIHNVLPSRMPHVVTFDNRDISYAEVHPRYRDKIFESANKLGSAKDWGLEKETYSFYSPEKELIKTYRIKMEPFNYATMLIRQWFDVFDQILVNMISFGTEKGEIKDPIEDIDRFKILGV